MSLSSRWTMPGRSTPPMPDRLVAAMGEQRVDQRAAGVAGRRVDHHAGRLDQHDQVLVLEQDLELARLGAGVRRRGGGTSSTIALARFDPAGRARLSTGCPPWRELAVAHQGLQPRRATARGSRHGQEQVEPLARHPQPGPTARSGRAGPPVAGMPDVRLLTVLKAFVVVGGVRHRRRHSHADLGDGPARHERHRRRPRRSRPPTCAARSQLPAGRARSAQMTSPDRICVLLGPSAGRPGQFIARRRPRDGRAPPACCGSCRQPP